MFGMKFGIKWSRGFPVGREDIAFHGKWVRSVIGQFVWTPMKCYDEKHHGPELYQNSHGQGALSTIKVSDIDWGNMGDSKVLTQLRQDAESSADRELVVRVSLFYHTQNYPPYVAHNATLGYVMGVIGVPSPSDTCSIPGERALFFKNNPVRLTFEPDDLCYGQNISAYGDWTNFAPVEVDRDRFEIRLDLSNSLSTDIFNNVRDIGTLRLGVLTNSCVQLLGENDEGLPYTSSEYFPLNSAIYTIPVDPTVLDTVSSNPLVVVQVLNGEEGSNEICGESTGNSAHIILQEYAYFIRPKNYYVDFLDRHNHPVSNTTVYVTKYGAPVSGLQVDVIASNELGSLGKVIPADGVIPSTWSSKTDERGLVTFEFKLNEDVRIPKERHYTNPPCTECENPDNRTTLPIDGQVYFFYYCTNESSVECSKYNFVRSYFLAFSDVEYTRPYTWVKDVGPILSQYARMAPIMRKVLDLNSYREVTRPRNLNLLNRTLRVDMDHPSHMPTTRDLSPVKRSMILEWLENPRYDASSYREPETCPAEHSFKTIWGHFQPPRCRESLLPFDTAPHHTDPYFNHIINQHHGPQFDFDASHHNITGRPLFKGMNCTVENVRRQLQKAIELEWSTLPVYLTALYSIVEGYNAEIYELIRSIVVQEMLHMVLSANILIAVDGAPLINDPSVTPSFPTTGLAGGVLPNLEVSLAKLTLRHVYRVFLGIEVPEETLVGLPMVRSSGYTIGSFYNEILECITELGDDIFDPSRLERQVKWPWTPAKRVGSVVPVTDVASARRAIDTIVSQGEGAGILDPAAVGGNCLAHFFKFEEIVCQRRLEKVSEHHYTYSGAVIPFDPKGVWPMRPNPSASTVLPDTNCYTLSRVFHQVYRMLLRKLQQVFNGHPEEVFGTVQLMESLQVHAKKLMWTKYRPDDPNDDTTCGPVWDYNWPGD